MGSDRIVILSESGLGTFRDAGGLWTRVDLAEVATPQGYARNPARALASCNARRAHGRAASPAGRDMFHPAR